MGLENYNIVDIEDTLIAKIKTLSLTSNLYPSGRPAVVVNTGMTEFLVVRTSTDVSDLGAHGRLITVIEIYTKNAGNLPNRSRISSIRNTITAVLPYSSDKFSYSYFTETPLAQDGNGYTFQMIKLITILKRF